MVRTDYCGSDAGAYGSAVTSTSVSATSADSVFDRYRPDAAAFDEFRDADGAVRPQWAPAVDRYRQLGDVALRQADRRIRTLVDDDGITGNAPDDDPTERRRWELDAIPLILDAQWWAAVERGVEQRSRVLDAVVADIYGEQRMISAGVLPPELVYGHPGYLRRAVRPRRARPRGVLLHACDIGRTPDGSPVVHADWTQAPSGIGYALADRRLLARTFPALMRDCVPRSLTAFAATLRLALFDCAPPGIEEPVVAVLTPGSLSATAFDEASLASTLGFPLVEAADLVVRDGAVYMRSLGRFKRLDVILRRVDADFADPLDLRADSRLGVAGLVEAIARGTVSVVNALGSGVLENPGLAAYLPALCRALLDEDLITESAPTLWGGADRQLDGLLADLPTLTLTNFRTGERFAGPRLTTAQCAALRARIAASGWQWVGRDHRDFSVAPSGTAPPRHAGGPRLRAAPVSVRAFSVARGSGYAVMPGGLGQVLPDDPGIDSTPIAAKDVWVTATESTTADGETVGRRVPDRAVGDRDVATLSETVFASSPRVLSDLFWFGRYGERAESTTRMVKVTRERYEDLRYRPWVSGAASSTPLFLTAVAEVTGIGAEAMPVTGADVGAMLSTMTAEATVTGTVAYAVDRLARSARAVRGQLSTSTWMVLGAVDRALAELASSADVDGGQLGRTHDDVLHGLLALSGLQAESMVRDPGWQFMDIGRRVERAQVLANLTAAVVGDRHEADAEQGLMEAYLAANESAIIYRRRNRGILRLVAVIVVMLFDEANPRSMIYQLHTLRDDLTMLPDSVRSAAAQRVVEDLVAALRRVDPTELAAVDHGGRRAELVALMRTLDAGLREVTDVLTRTRFAYPVDTQPLWGAGSEGGS